MEAYYLENRNATILIVLFFEVTWTLFYLMEISTIGREGHHDRSEKMSGFKRNYQQACRK